MDVKKRVLGALENKSVYKVQCEFYILAEDKDDAEEIIYKDICENDFLEEHILIEEADLPEDETIFNE